jgi:two-component system, OmpR family, response regulator
VSATPPRVLLVEDDAGLRLAVCSAFRDAGLTVHDEADGTRIREVATTFAPDLAVLDVRLPIGPNGLTIARLLRDQVPDLPIVFLTAADATDDRLAGFEAGGDDYVPKPFAMAELLARITALLRRSGRLSSQVLQVGDVVIDEARRRVVRAGTELELTRTEFDLLHELARNPDRVLSKTQLLTSVWGFAGHDVNVVEVHVSALRRKLEEHGPRLVHTVRGAGYRLRPGSD